VPPAPDAAVESAKAEALAHRMVVMASKGLVAEMMEDLISGLQHRYSPTERGGFNLRYCADAICTGYAYDAINDDFDAFLKAIEPLKSTRGGRAAIVHFARGLVRLAKSYPGSMNDRALKLFRAMQVAYRAMC
jgi:hypothetical protein